MRHHQKKKKKYRNAASHITKTNSTPKQIEDLLQETIIYTISKRPFDNKTTTPTKTKNHKASNTKSTQQKAFKTAILSSPTRSRKAHVFQGTSRIRGERPNPGHQNPSANGWPNLKAQSRKNGAWRGHLSFGICLMVFVGFLDILRIFGALVLVLK